jgi:hypothetical protein
MQIRSDMDLPTLRILLDPTRSSFVEVEFQAVRGRGSPSTVARCGLRDLGLPDSLTGLRPIDDSAVTIPPDLLNQLSDAADGLGQSPVKPESALWLEFPSPRGFLYVVPWERLLAPLERPLFRLPNHLVRPQASGAFLEVAICASSPAAKAAMAEREIMEALTEKYLVMTGLDVTVHLFTDYEWFSMVQSAVHQFGDRVRVHDPGGAPDPRREYDRRARSSTPSSVSNPWLAWITDALKGRPLDVVHFVTHGFLSGDRGAIAVASSPTLNTDRVSSRFIEAAEVTTFLAEVGAWGLVLSGPPDNYSDAGLRELADTVARVRAGLTAVHEIGADPQCEQFGSMLATVLSSEEPSQHALPASTCWVHPRFVEFPGWLKDELHINADGSSAFVSGATKAALETPGTEAWVASASRALEAQQMRWLPDTEEERADPAAVTALSNVASLIERHVSRQYPDGATSQGDQ